MIFASFLVTSILLSIITAIILLRLLKQMISLTVTQIIAEDLRAPWLKYVHIALLIVGVSSGVNIGATRELINQRNLQTISVDVFLIQVWASINSTAIAIILSVLVLFFIYLLIYYLNQFVGDRKS
jgi:hypothetical protein